MAFELIITTAGLAAIAAGPSPVLITQIGLSETAIIASPTDTILTDEFKRLTTFGGLASAADTISLQILDDSSAAFTLRALALYLSDGTLFALYGQPAPILEKTAASLMLLAADIKLADLEASNITFGDTNFVNPSATETQSGVVRFATAAELELGTADNLAASPKNIKDTLNVLLGGEIDKTLAPYGHYVLPGGLIINWGFTGSITPDSFEYVTFHKEFTTACFIVVPVVETGAANDDMIAAVLSKTRFGATLARGATGNSSSGGLGYIAVGA